MKKKLITMAIATIAIFGYTATAQTVDNNAQPNQNCPMSAQNDKMHRPQSFQEFAFEGILLDMDQQARIDSLNNAMAQQRQDMRQQRRERRDSLAQCEDEGKCQRNNPQREYIGKVKEILTPDQYVTFLENIVFMQEEAPQFGRPMNARNSIKANGKLSKKMDREQIDKMKKSKDKIRQQQNAE